MDTMKKTLAALLSLLPEGALDYTVVAADGTEQPLAVTAAAIITSLVFDSRDVQPQSLFFALPGTHTTGNRFVASAIASGASAVVFQDSFTLQEQADIARAMEARPLDSVVFLHVSSSRFAMSPLSAAFYDNPSEKLIVYGVTGTEGKSSTVAFIWQLLRLCGHKAGFVSTVQYSLGGEAIDNPQHQTTPEATIVQRELHQMVQNGCTHAVVESSSHGLSPRTNRLGDVHFDCAVFMNVTLEHLEFHGSLEQYRNDKANLFRALDKWSHNKIIGGVQTEVPSFGVINLEDPASEFFVSCTKKKVFGFTTEGKAGKQAQEEVDAKPLPPVPEGVSYLCARNIAATKLGLAFSIHRFESHDSSSNKNLVLHVRAPLPGAFNAYNIMAALLAVHGTTGTPLETLVTFTEQLVPVKGRMTAVDCGQPFEVIVDYAHTPSSFETIFPPLKKRCTGRLLCVFGSGGERDKKKRPLQGAIAAQFCDIVILTDEDPRGEDRMVILEQIAGDHTAGARSKGKIDGTDLLLIPDRPSAIRTAFSLARPNDIVLLLGKSHENSIIYKDRAMPFDEIAEAKKALAEIGFQEEEA